MKISPVSFKQFVAPTNNTKGAKAKVEGKLKEVVAPKVDTFDKQNSQPLKPIAKAEGAQPITPVAEKPEERTDNKIVKENK